METKAWSWRIVLVRPRNPLNIGAAARAMANFGLRDLVAVAPYSPVWQEARSAVAAEEVVKSARTVDHLQDAIADCTLVVGTTAGSRRSLERELILLNELAVWLQGVPARAREAEGQGRGASERGALLFGSEKTGLSNEQMSYCHALVRIPTSSDCPSINLGQAVALCCYELARSGIISVRPPPARVHRSAPANAQSLEHILARAARVLNNVGYLKPKSRKATLIKLRRLLLDLRLTNHDARVLGGILAQIDWKLGIGMGSG